MHRAIGLVLGIKCQQRVTSFFFSFLFVLPVVFRFAWSKWQQLVTVPNTDIDRRGGGGGDGTVLLLSTVAVKSAARPIMHAFKAGLV